MLLVALLGLCTIFATVVTVVEAWQRWPQVTARVDECGLSRTSTGRRQKFYIRCRLSYALGSERNVAKSYSSTVLSPDIWQYPPNQIAPFEQWVDEHPPGTPIVVRYDPANHTKVVLAGNYMPCGGPRTQDNMKLSRFFAGSFLVLLTIARALKPANVPS